MSIVGAHVVWLIEQAIGMGERPEEASRDTLKLAGSIIRLIRQAESGEVDVEEEDDVECAPEQDDDDDARSQCSSADEDMDEDGIDMVMFDDKMIAASKVDEAYEHYRSPIKGSRSLQAMHSRVRFIRTQHHLKLLRAFGEGQSTVGLVYRQRCLGEIVRKEVLNLFNSGTKISDLDIQRIALEQNEKLKLLAQFKASHSWAQQFKRRYGFASRKITKFVTRKSLLAKSDIEKAASDIVDTVAVASSQNPNLIICNLDQSGILKELHCARTLAPVGVKNVEIVTQSKSSLTHSYTVMPILYANGKMGK